MSQAYRTPVGVTSGSAMAVAVASATIVRRWMSSGRGLDTSRHAGRALAVPRFYGARKVPPQIQRMRADDLLASVFPAQVGCQENVTGPLEIPDHPLVRQTVIDCMHEAMDLDGTARLLEGRGLMARAFNHEIDHLNGSLFIEHLSALKRRFIKKKVQKRMREGDWQLVPA